jgi:hypothetical protein
MKFHEDPPSGICGQTDKMKAKIHNEKGNENYSNRGEAGKNP